MFHCPEKRGFGSQEPFRLVRWLSGGRARRPGSVCQADDVAGAAWPLGHDERAGRVARTAAVAVFSVPIGMPAGREARWFAARLRGSTVSNHWRHRLRRDKATRLTAFNVSTVQTQEGLVPADSPHELAAGSAGSRLLTSIVKPTVREPDGGLVPPSMYHPWRASKGGTRNRTVAAPGVIRSYKNPQ